MDSAKLESQSVEKSTGRFPSDVLFVFGAARSGTTYLNNLLDKWFDFGMGPEGKFVIDFARRLHRYGDLGDDANLNRLVRDVARCEMLEIARHKYSPETRFDVTPEMLLAQLPERSYAGIVYSVLANVAAAQNRTHVGNKNPIYWRDLPKLRELFPAQAKYLCIVRDGRDVALSTMRIHWGQRSVYMCAQTWAQSIRAVEAFAQIVSPDVLLVVRYEDLLEDPAVMLPKLEAFLGVPLGARKSRLLAEAQNNPKRLNFGKWREQLSASDIRLFEAVAGPELSRYGYERQYAAPRAHIHERIYYRLAEYVRLLRVNLGSLIGHLSSR